MLGPFETAACAHRHASYYPVRGLVYYSWGKEQKSFQRRCPGKSFPQKIGEWSTSSDIPIEQMFLDRLRPDEYVNRIYERSGRVAAIGVFLLHISRRSVPDLTHIPPRIACRGAGWKTYFPGDRAADCRRGKRARRRQPVRRSKRITLNWPSSIGFNKAGRSFTNEIVAQILCDSGTDAARPHRQLFDSCHRSSVEWVSRTVP